MAFLSEATAEQALLDQLSALGYGVRPARASHDDRGAVVLTFDVAAALAERGRQVTPQVTALLFRLHGEMTRQAMQEALGLSDREHFRKAYLAARAGARPGRNEPSR